MAKYELTDLKWRINVSFPVPRPISNGENPLSAGAGLRATET